MGLNGVELVVAFVVLLSVVLVVGSGAWQFRTSRTARSGPIDVPLIPVAPVAVETPDPVPDVVGSEIADDFSPSRSDD